MNNDNFITIAGWMINELGLSGNELLAYALIYGFSQDGQTSYKGGNKYIADTLKCSERTVVNVLGSLVDKGLIAKETETICGVVFNKYSICSDFQGGCKNFTWGSEKIALGPSEKISAHRNSNNIGKDSREIKEDNSLHSLSKKSAEKKPKVDRELARNILLELSVEPTEELLDSVDGFIENRKQSKYQLTARALRLNLRDAVKLSRENPQFSVQDIIDAAVANCWRGIWLPNRKTTQGDKLSDAELMRLKAQGKIAPDYNPAQHYDSISVEL